MRLPPLPDGIERDQLQLVHVHCMGFEDDGSPVDIDIDGCHAINVWLEAKIGPHQHDWCSVKGFDLTFTDGLMTKRALDYAWAVAAKYSLNVEVRP